MKLLKRIFFFVTLFFLFPTSAFAIYDPLSVPNNKIGMHLLFPEEIEKAAGIINNQGQAAWGYVTIPIQSTDRNRDRWQKFMDKAKELKVIPIIRVATLAEGSNWATPEDYDFVDFANFLGDLTWPTMNHYVIILNEVNRADEFGGYASPEKYADLLMNAIEAFKSKSPDFFILPAGLDNAASNSKNSLNWRLYIDRMYLKQPEVFNRIDGWTSHAYPNPAFSASPDKSGSNRIDSFMSDLVYLRNFTLKKLPVFITETGWSNKTLSDRQIANNYNFAFVHIWSNDQVVAVTPFLLDAKTEPFNQFSFLDQDNNLLPSASVLSSFAKTGEPILPPPPTPEPTPTLKESPTATPSPSVAPTPTTPNIFDQIIRFLNSFISKA